MYYITTNKDLTEKQIQNFEKKIDEVKSSYKCVEQENSALEKIFFALFDKTITSNSIVAVANLTDYNKK